MNYFQRRMMHKGMGKRCPIRLSLTMSLVAFVIIAVGVASALFVLHLIPKEQELHLEALEAKKDRDELLAVLEGRRTWITADGEQYARVEWVKAKQLIGE